MRVRLIISALCLVCAFFLVVEPVGSVGPKVTSSIELTSVGASDTVSLLCPAQSYPVPVFR